jgi:hypothetical protein
VILNSIVQSQSYPAPDPWEAALLALTLIREDRTPQVKCCASCLSIRSHGSRVRVSPLLVDIVAKVPKGAAANFPLKNETSDNRRSMGLQTRYQNRV